MTALIKCNDIKSKIKICDELISFCDLLNVEIGYLQKPLPQILSQNNTKTKFICFSEEENIRINEFFYDLGKSDVDNEIKKTKAFKVFMTQLKNNYGQEYKSKSKVYVTFSFFVGMVISLVLI